AVPSSPAGIWGGGVGMARGCLPKSMGTMFTAHPKRCSTTAAGRTASCFTDVTLRCGSRPGTWEPGGSQRKCARRWGCESARGGTVVENDNGVARERSWGWFRAESQPYCVSAELVVGRGKHAGRAWVGRGRGPEGKSVATKPADTQRTSTVFDSTCLLAPVSSCCGRCDEFLGIQGLHPIECVRDHRRLVITVETASDLEGCRVCGLVAHGHGRQQRILHDIPAFGTPVRLIWR